MGSNLMIPHQVYWVTAWVDKVGVASGHAHLITSGDFSINGWIPYTDD